MSNRAALTQRLVNLTDSSRDTKREELECRAEVGNLLFLQAQGTPKDPEIQRRRIARYLARARSREAAARYERAVVLRRQAREVCIARAFLRGRAYNQIESPYTRLGNGPDWGAVESLILEYGQTPRHYRLDPKAPEGRVRVEAVDERTLIQRFSQFLSMVPEYLGGHYPQVGPAVRPETGPSPEAALSREERKTRWMADHPAEPSEGPVCGDRGETL